MSTSPFFKLFYFFISVISSLLPDSTCSVMDMIDDFSTHMSNSLYIYHLSSLALPSYKNKETQEQNLTRSNHISFTQSVEQVLLEMAGQSNELKLLGTFSSPFALRVKLALSFKGLSYEYIEEKDLHNSKSELLLKSNPVHKKVPVLFHNGKPVCESMIIIQYLEEAFADAGPSLLPSDPHERAVARFWAAYIDEKVHTKSRQIIISYTLSLTNLVFWRVLIVFCAALQLVDDGVQGQDG